MSVSLADLRTEWARLQREPIDGCWLGPGDFVERLMGFLEEQQRAIGSLRTALAPFLMSTPTHGQLQVAIAQQVWKDTEPWSAASPR